MANAKWLNEAEMKAWRGFVTTAAELHRVIESDLEQFGIDTGDYQLLAMLSEAPEHRMQLCELAEILRLSRSGLTRRMEGVVKAIPVVVEAVVGQFVTAGLAPPGDRDLRWRGACRCGERNSHRSAR